MRVAVLSVLPVCFLIACNGEEETPDTGVVDTGYDAGVEPDAGHLDAEPPPDAGKPDVGFADPNIILQEETMISGTRTHIHLRGTKTSTMPPLIMLPTGPHMGGISAFFGSALGGGIGHEYLPEHMDFLLPGRLMVYFDFRATGRSGFGPIGTASITVDAHVLQVTEVLDWLRDVQQIDTAQVDILGHGYGAGVGSLFAVAHPGRVNQLVLVTPMGINIDQFVTSITTMKSRLTTDDRARLDAITREPECFGNTNQCTIEVWRIVVPRLMCASTRDLARDLDFLYGDLRGFEFVRWDLTERQFDWAPRLANISSTTTVISGACDAIPAEAAQAYSSTISGARHHIITESGHFPMVEAPAAFQRHLKEALTY